MKEVLALALLAVFSVCYAMSYPQHGSATNLSTAVRASQISDDVFRCDSSNAIHRALCKAALDKVNSELDKAGISIDRNGVLFVYDDPTDRKINTGKSCTVTAEQKHQHLEARFKSSARLRLNGNSLTEPFVLRLKLPVTLSGRVEVKQRFGVRVPRISKFRIRTKCKNYASDSYSLKGSISTNANMGVGFYLKPSLGTVKSGDYAIVLQPIVRVVTKLESTDIRLRTSGVNPIAAVWSKVVGWTSTLTKVADAALNGRSISTVIKKNAAWDIGSAVVLGIGLLPAPLEKLIWKLLSFVGEFFARKKAKGYGKDLEDDLNRKVRRALKVGADGKRVIIIKQNFMRLLRVGGEKAKIFVTPSASVDCKKIVNSLCSACRGCSECYAEAAKCSAGQRAAVQKWTPKNLVHSLPKIATRASPTPAPRRTVQDNGTCYSRANAVCSACKGCAECQYRISQCDRMMSTQ